MAVINCVSAEYDSASQDLSNVDCFRSLLVAHSKALYELASAAKAAGVNLQLTEQQNAQAVGNSRSVVVSGSSSHRTAQVFAVA